MKLQKIFITLVIIMINSIFFSSCNSSSANEPENTTSLNITENIIGKWLLSTSSDNEWATYEFSETSRIKANIYSNNQLREGSGFYWVDEEKHTLTGNYDFSNGSTEYIDWIVDDIDAFEIELQLYDNNEFVSKASIYRILSTLCIEVGETIVLDFKAMCGSDKVSNLKLLNESIATTDGSSQINGKKIGSTYLTFSTSKGTGAILIEVSPQAKSFSELMVGSWIYDKLSDKEWQKTTFVDDGYIDVQWANPYNYNIIETATGYYTITNDKLVNFSVTTPYNATFNQEWNTIDINDFIWTYQAFSDNVSVGTYTGQRLLGSVTLSKDESVSPDFQDLTFGYDIIGFESHNPIVAVIDNSGRITAHSKGRTYIDIKTEKGAGVYEVCVE